VAGGPCTRMCRRVGPCKTRLAAENRPIIHKQIQNSPSTARTCLLMVQDIKCDPGAPFGHGRYGRRAVHTHVPQGWASQNETSCGKWALKTQTNTELPIHRPHMPADGPGHQVRPRRTFWSWQIWQEGRAHACAAGLGLAKRDQLWKMGPENTNKYRTPHPPPAYAC